MALEFEKEQTQVETTTFENHEDPKEAETASVTQEEETTQTANVSEADQDQVVDLFGNPIEEKPKEKKKSISKASSKAKEDEKYGVDYTVFYAGHAVQVPEDGMTTEQIRQYMESDFPELSKERTTFDVDKEKKHLYARVSGAKKG